MATTKQSPASLDDLLKLHPDLDPNVIYYITRTKCTAVDNGDFYAGSGNRRGSRYEPGEFSKKVAKWRKEKKPSDCLEFKENGITWVAEEKLKSHGVHREKADRLFKKQKIGTPKIVPLAGPTPWYRKFWPLEDVRGAMEIHAVPKSTRDKSRTPAEIAALTDMDFVTLPEAISLSFSEYYLRAHSSGLEDKRRKHEPTPAAPIRRLIEGRWCDRVSARNHLVKTPSFKLGDLREIIKRRDHPPVPKDCVLIRDAIARLKDEGINVARWHLVTLIKNKIVGGGEIDSFKRNFSPEKMWYVVWEDRHKIPGSPDTSRLPIEQQYAHEMLTEVHTKVTAIDRRTKVIKRTTKGNAIVSNEIHSGMESLFDRVKESTPEPVEAILSKRQTNILQAMLEMGATCSDEREAARMIATKAESNQADPDGFKKSLSDLKQRGFIESAIGAGGGYWLTANGMNRAEKIRIPIHTPIVH